MKELNRKSGFLVTCVSCIVLILALCYLGVNTTFKGTAALNDYFCGSGYDLVGSGNTYYCCPTKSTGNGYTDVQLVGGNAYCTRPENFKIVEDGSGGGACTGYIFKKLNEEERELLASLYGNPSFRSKAGNGLVTVNGDSSYRMMDSEDYSNFKSLFKAQHGGTDLVTYKLNEYMSEWKGSGWISLNSSSGAIVMHKDYLASDSTNSNRLYIKDTSGDMYFYMQVEAPVTSGGKSCFAKATQAKSSSDKACFREKDLGKFVYTTYAIADSKGYKFISDTDGEYSCLEKNKVNVTFDANGGKVTVDGRTGEKLSVAYNIGDKIGTLPTPTKTGYKFEGWTLDLNASSVDYISKDHTVRSSSTVYAVWSSTNTSTTSTCNIKLDLQGGTLVDTTLPAELFSPNGKDFVCGNHFALPLPKAVKHPSGYTLYGWGTSPNATMFLTSPHYVLKTTETLYALWKDDNTGDNGGGTSTNTTKTFTAKFYEADGSSKVIKTLTCSGTKSCTLKESEVPTPTKANYKFTGWHTTGENTCYENDKLTLWVTTVHYYPCFKQIASGSGSDNTPEPTPDDEDTKTFTATFNSNGGTLSGKEKLSCSTTGSNCTINGGLPISTKPGYSFKGWGSTTDCTSGNTDSVKLTSNKTFYACFVKNGTTNDNTSDGNVKDNPTTGEITIAIIWFLGLLAIGYSFYYFKSLKQN